MKLVHTISHSSKVHDARFVFLPGSDTQEVLLIGADDGQVSAYVVPSDTETVPYIVASFVGHQNR